MSKWSAFTRENRELWLTTDVPVDMTEDEQAFVYLLMHGAHPSYSYFRVEDLTPDARSALVELVVRYVVEFGDPGLWIFDPETQGRIKALAAERA